MPNDYDTVGWDGMLVEALSEGYAAAGEAFGDDIPDEVISQMLASYDELITQKED